MAGIVSYGIHIPVWRLSLNTIAQAWGTAPAEGERSVANHDEDSVTMAVEAAFCCLAAECWRLRRLMSYSEPASKCFGTHLRQSVYRSCGFHVL